MIRLAFIDDMNKRVKKSFLFKKNKTLVSNVNEINKASKLIMEAKKPIIYIGGGLINSGPRAIKELNLSNYK